ncbi:hypothetical protein QL285_045332 [Trifolium repens]|jgi:hypothetical protein|nr:hypothetical protein QL285_045332 [Trifolium repens]
MIDRGKHNDGNPLLGFVRQEKPHTVDEEELMKRSEKKAKSSGENYSGDSTRPISYEDVYEDGVQKEVPGKTQSYKQSLLSDRVGPDYLVARLK